MYIPRYPGLSAREYFGKETGLDNSVFPLNAPSKKYSYMARNLIYHLFRCLDLGPEEVVLVPDYHSGIEVWAMKSAGAKIVFYPIRQDMEPDLETLSNLCETTNAKVLYTIHYLGWPQPVKKLKRICSKHNLILVEDCALSLLSNIDNRPLGSYGDFAIFCLYKTLPLPHGGLLVQNSEVIPELEKLSFTPSNNAAVIGQHLQLILEKLRSHSDYIGRLLYNIKVLGGNVLTAFGIRRVPVGDVTPEFSSAGFQLENMNIGMSKSCERLLKGMDLDKIRAVRRANYSLLYNLLKNEVPTVRNDLPVGMCPLFYPLLVSDKQLATKEFSKKRIGTVEFWNYGYPEESEKYSRSSKFLRDHVIELPIHQDITPDQIKYIAKTVLELKDVICNLTKDQVYSFHPPADTVLSEQ